MRLLSQRLETAERHLDRRLEIAKQRKAEVGFVKEVLSSSGCTSVSPAKLVHSDINPPVSPLPPKAAALQETLTNLHQTLSPLDIPPPTSSSVPTAGGHTKAWELGRRAYLNWAVGKMVSGSGAGQAEGGAGDRMEGVEEEMRGMGGREGMEKLAKAVGA